MNTTVKATHHRCWNCTQPARNVFTREGSKTLHACDYHTRVDRAEAESKGWTVAPLAIATHPLLACLPEAHGPIVRTAPVGPGIVTVQATLDGEYEVTGWRPLDEWEVAADRQAFPGETGLPTAAYVTARIVPDPAGVDAAVAEAVAALGVALALEVAEI